MRIMKFYFLGNILGLQGRKPTLSVNVLDLICIPCLFASQLPVKADPETCVGDTDCSPGPGFFAPLFIDVGRLYEVNQQLGSISVFPPVGKEGRKEGDKTGTKAGRKQKQSKTKQKNRTLVEVTGLSL